MVVYRPVRVEGPRSAAHRALRGAAERWRRGVWRGFGLAYRGWRALGGAPPAEPRGPDRVLHVSPPTQQPFLMTRLLRERGVRSDYLAVETGHGAGTLELGWDHEISGRLRWAAVRPFLEVAALLRILRDYDVVHYHFAAYVGPDGCELEYLKGSGKGVVVHFRGCDLRSRGMNRRLYPELNICEECDYGPGACETSWQRRAIELARRYADRCLVTTRDLLPLLPGTEHLPFLEPPPDLLASIPAAPRDPSVFRVVTSSNHPGIDGVRFVREAVARLAQEGARIELVEVRNTPWREALALYRSADAYAGKLRLGDYNNSHIECMALGLPVFSYLNPDVRRAVPDCPIIDARPETIYAQLKEHLERRDELAAIGARGPAFVRAHHGRDVVVAALRDCYRRSLRGARVLPVVQPDVGSTRTA